MERWNIRALAAATMASLSRMATTRPPVTRDPMAVLLDRVVTRFESRDGVELYDWTVRDSCEGTQIFGGTGAGKSSGSGRQIALGMLSCGFGGLVLTAKPDECQQWVEYAAEIGRSADLIIVRPGGSYRFNFLNYEFQRSPGMTLTYNLAALFCIAMEGGQERESTTDPYWEDALRQLLINSNDLEILGSGAVTLPNLAEIIRTAPLRRTDPQSTRWRRDSLCWRRMEQAQSADLTAERRLDLVETIKFFLLDYAGLADRTRSVVVSSFMSKATALIRSPLRELFCSSQPDTFTPDDSHRGKIIVLDLPVKEYGEAGRFAQIIYKTVWQRSTERRSVTAGTPPVFLWADESQYFVTTHDMLFQSTARSTLAATVYLTQNIATYYANMRGRSGHAATDSLLGNLQTKILHQNGDPSTNEWAERLFAKDILRMRGSNVNSDGLVGRNVQESYHPVVPAKTFTTLKKGGPENNRIVEAVIFQGGRRTGAKGPHFLMAQFHQKGAVSNGRKRFRNPTALP